MTARPKLLIIDQSLRNQTGHHFEYDLALVRAARTKGIETIVGGHVDLKISDLDGAKIYPWFTRVWFESNRSAFTNVVLATIQRLPDQLQVLARDAGIMIRRAMRRSGSYQGALGSSRFGHEVVNLIKHVGLGAADHALIHTLSIPELDDLIEALGGGDVVPCIHIVLRRDAEEPAVANGLHGGIAGSFSRILANPRIERCLRFYADTEQLVSQYSKIGAGIKISVVPIPNCIQAVKDDTRAGGPLRIVYLGDARLEKGFHLLPDVIDRLAGQLLSTRRARFIIQCNTNVLGGEPGIARARRRLMAYPKDQIELVNRELNMAEFYNLLISADIVLLPYDANSYRRRSSGILVEALILGRPVVVPAHSWLSFQIDPDTGRLFDETTPLDEAILSVVENWPALRAAACARAPMWGGRHNAGRYIDQLLEAKCGYTL